MCPSSASCHQRLSRNLRGRDIVVGDIHGHFTRLSAELERIGFDGRRDRLICCGDLVDRGPESPRAAEWLAQPWFFSVMGNHDASLLQRHGLLGARFELWHDHHGWSEALDPAARESLLARLAALPWALEVETAAGAVGIVHAEVPEDCASWRDFLAGLGSESLRLKAISNRRQAMEAVDLADAEDDPGWRLAGVDWVIHGHTPRRRCRPGRLGNRLWIETLGWYDHPLEHGRPHFTLLWVEQPLAPL